MVIGVVLVLIAVVANLHPRPISGLAAGAPVPQAPAVGDCVLDPLPDRSWAYSDTQTVTPRTPVSVPSYPSQRMQTCGGARYGEVIVIISSPSRTEVEGTDEQGFWINDPNWESCYSAMQRYLGIPAKPLYATWSVSSMTTVALVGPTARQLAAGQHWAACVVALQTPGEWASANPPTPRYSGTVREALHTGQHRDEIGLCAASIDVRSGADTIRCGQPHPAEWLGFGESGAHPRNRSDVDASCRQVAGQLTGLPDPTAGGLLSTVVTATDSENAPVSGPQIPAHSYLSCGVTSTGGKNLKGSLLALGRQPIPWA